MACEPFTYSGITQEIFDCFKANAIKQGVHWDGDNRHGTFSKTQVGQTVKTEYEYDPSATTLKLQVVEKPFFISCDFLYGKFHEGLEICGAKGTLVF